MYCRTLFSAKLRQVKERQDPHRAAKDASAHEIEPWIALTLQTGIPIRSTSTIRGSHISPTSSLRRLLLRHRRHRHTNVRLAKLFVINRVGRSAH